MDTIDNIIDDMIGLWIVEVLPDGTCEQRRLITCSECRHWRREDNTARDAFGSEWHWCRNLKTETAEYDFCSGGREDGNQGDDDDDRSRMA